MVDIPKDWKPPKFTKEDNPFGLLTESSFSILYPKYRELYIRQNWSLIEKKFHEYDLIAELDALQGVFSVKTTRKTWDPYIIIKARDALKLIARNVPYEQAIKILEDDIVSDVIKIGSLVRNKERFVKRRQRLVGMNGSTLKALELLTNSYIMVHGNTVSAIGTYSGIKEVRKLVEDAMKNVHPIYNIKALMIKKELFKDERLRGENWERFLPKFNKNRPKNKFNSSPGVTLQNNLPDELGTTDSKSDLKKRKKKKFIAKKEYTPFPPPPVPSKIDKEIETGEYFLKHSIKKQQELIEKKRKQKLVTDQKKVKKMKIFEAPKEDNLPTSNTNLKTNSENKGVDVKKLKKKLKKIEQS